MFIGYKFFLAMKGWKKQNAIQIKQMNYFGFLIYYELLMLSIRIFCSNLFKLKT